DRDATVPVLNRAAVVVGTVVGNIEQGETGAPAWSAVRLAMNPKATPREAASSAGTFLLLHTKPARIALAAGLTGLLIGVIAAVVAATVSVAWGVVLVLVLMFLVAAAGAVALWLAIKQLRAALAERMRTPFGW